MPSLENLYSVPLPLVLGAERSRLRGRALAFAGGSGGVLPDLISLAIANTSPFLFTAIARTSVRSKSYSTLALPGAVILYSLALSLEPAYTVPSGVRHRDAHQVLLRSVEVDLCVAALTDAIQLSLRPGRGVERLSFLVTKATDQSCSVPFRVTRSVSLPWSHFITLPSGKVPSTTTPPQASTNDVTTSVLVSASTLTVPPVSTWSSLPSLPVPSSTEPSRSGSAASMAASACDTGTEPKLVETGTHVAGCVDGDPLQVTTFEVRTTSRA